jgi:methylenetetrahydrofolate reductase (NADPH)
LTKKAHLHTIPSIFHCDFPEELAQALLEAPDDRAAQQIGIDWAYRQSIDLLENGYRNLHFYIMQYTKPFVTLMDRLKPNF